MPEAATLSTLEGKILVLGCSTVHGEELSQAVARLAPQADVISADELKGVPRADVYRVVFFEPSARRRERALADLRRRFATSQLVAVVPAATVDTLTFLLRGGCDDFLVAAPEPGLSDTLQQVFQRATTEQASTQSPRGSYRDFQELGIIGRSRALRETQGLIRRAAASPVTVLITGESGTGKELVARAVHEFSERRTGAFVAVNCGAIPKPLLESELFGHVRGAFSGAFEDKLGLLVQADGGTLFLDEICDLPLEMQVKINRVLQERSVRRLGDTVERRVDVRFVAASNKSFEEEIRHGNFREDLYFRLNVLRIRLPPLRDRSRDIVHLAEHFVARFAEREGKRVEGISPDAMKILLAYQWPGNVRELQHMVESAVLMAQTTVLTPEDLPVEIPISSGRRDRLLPDMSLPYNDAMRRLRQEASQSYVEEVLSRFGGNVSAAARHAELPRESFHRILRKFGIKAADMKKPDRGR